MDLHRRCSGGCVTRTCSLPGQFYPPRRAKDFGAVADCGPLGLPPVSCRTRLFGGGAEEDAAHLALAEIEDDAAVDRTHDKGAGIA
jgi:hypothetical protein